MTILLHDLVGSDASRPFSPHCWRAALALAHKGLDFESVPTRFTEVREVEEGASGTVPVIRDGDTVVADSFAIAAYLEEAYPDRPSLFGGQGGLAAARFVERWSERAINIYVVRATLMDIHDSLDLPDRTYFRQTRERRFGKRLEDVPRDREAGLDAFRAGLEPLRGMLDFQAFLGGDGPLFADYILAGSFQWPRVVSSFRLLEPDDPVAGWFERCLDLHGGLARRVPAVV